jgi:hypothetical protein
MADQPHRSVKGCEMEYQGKRYNVVQGIDGNWKWLVDDLAGHTKSGTAPSRAAGIKAAERAIDKALAPKKVRLVPPAP